MRKPAPLFIIVFVILFLSCSALAAESNCPCQRPTVGRYDLNVQVQRPANPSANWLYLFEIGTAVGAGLFESDTCTSHKDGALLNALADPKSTMRTGTEYANLPPPGRVPGLDYLLTGSVQAGAGGYSVTVWIETAVSREKVKSTSFNLAANFTLDQLTAGEKSAVAALGPLGKTISEWEASKRDSDKEVALGDSGEALTVDPVKTSLKRGESTELRILLADCDGKALPGRQIVLDKEVDPELGTLPGPAVKGRVSPARVVTDGSGKATATFTAGNEPGTGTIEAHSTYLRPPGDKAAFLAKGFVSIGGAKWLLKIDLVRTKTTQYYEDEPRKFGSWSTRTIVGNLTARYSLQTVVPDNAFMPAPPGSDIPAMVAAQLGTPALMNCGDNARFKGHVEGTYYEHWTGRTIETKNGRPRPYDGIEKKLFITRDDPKGNNPGCAITFSLGKSPMSPGGMRLSVVAAGPSATQSMRVVTFHTDEGWNEQNQELPAVGEASVGMECTQGDQGAQFTARPNLYTATCRKVETSTGGGPKEITETRAYVTLRRLR